MIKDECSGFLNQGYNVIYTAYDCEMCIENTKLWIYKMKIDSINLFRFGRNEKQDRSFFKSVFFVKVRPRAIDKCEYQFVLDKLTEPKFPVIFLKENENTTVIDQAYINEDIKKYGLLQSELSRETKQ